MSSPSMLGAVFYALVVLASIFAARTAWRHHHVQIRGMAPFWIGSALVFAGLVAARVTLAEDRLRALLRLQLREAGSYDEREAVQLAASLAALAIAALFALWWGRGWVRSRGDPIRRMVRLAQLGIAGMVPLWGLRIASLHAVDRLLYSGPLRLNWIIDIGLAATVGLAAVLFVRHIRALDRLTARGRRDRR